MTDNDAMKKILITLLLLLPAVMPAWAQKVPEGYVQADSLVYRSGTAVDSTLVGKSIFSILPSKGKGDKADVKVHQSQAISSALQNQVSNNASRSFQGYRIRIYSDNSQNARSASESVMYRFQGGHYGVAVYRSYEYPFFRVTVGDFRTRSEALELLSRIKGAYPSAFVVRERINYPPVDQDHAYQIDTVKVLRRTL